MRDAATHLQSPRVNEELVALRRHLVPMLPNHEIDDIDRELAALLASTG